MEFSDLQMFIKKNSKIVSLNIDYNTDEGDVYNYKINAEGIDYNLKFITDTETIKMIYDDKTIDNDNDIQLELFEMLNYKNIEYIDCYIIKKRNDNNNFEIIDMYDDTYYNNIDKLICNRSFKKDDKIIKIKIVYQYNDYKLYYGGNEISGFDEILRKIDMILSPRLH
jgi:hypothetical protein